MSGRMDWIRMMATVRRRRRGVRETYGDWTAALATHSSCGGRGFLNSTAADTGTRAPVARRLAISIGRSTLTIFRRPQPISYIHSVHTSQRPTLDPVDSIIWLVAMSSVKRATANHRFPPNRSGTSRIEMLRIRGPARPGRWRIASGTCRGRRREAPFSATWLRYRTAQTAAIRVACSEYRVRSTTTTETWRTERRTGEPLRRR